MIVLLTNFTTSFTLSPELEKFVYDLYELPFFPPDKGTAVQYKKLTQFNYVQILRAVRSGYSIMTVNYNPLIGQILNDMRNGKKPPNASDWTILSFFHNDKALENTGILVAPRTPINPRILLDTKRKDSESISAYPFIKKYIIPYKHVITFDYLNELIEKKSPNKE